MKKLITVITVFTLMLFDYTFDRLADVMNAFIEKLNLQRYSLYVMHYGAPIGFRLAMRHPERVESLIIQNGNAYVEGLREFWDPVRKYWNDRSPENAKPLARFISPEGVKWQYTHGVRNTASISPDNWNVDLRHLTKKGNPAIQLALFMTTKTISPTIRPGRPISANINHRR
ncbi:hypothetical protein DSCA_48030 [Desulfosarcina alkanivorans]|uniref:AB hydrolase-1 domain-containing protein n=1 Tax=Desulfosarcina alkanivorans TaxID=571177 RepID=A0A5K7YRI7_9BACT|nr:alpha/beta fold hydrolase [Desulfosarcina alkanivorans]BBO70873.1 hypothetical protein DSCA_48030 [Desulfosarcina alkanivorans]